MSRSLRKGFAIPHLGENTGGEWLDTACFWASQPTREGCIDRAIVSPSGSLYVPFKAALPSVSWLALPSSGPAATGVLLEEGAALIEAPLASMGQGHRFFLRQ